MVAAVLDTNVLATGFLSRETAPRQVMLAWRAGLFHLVISEQIIAELTRTLAKGYFSKRLTTEQKSHGLALLREEATVTPIVAHVSGIATHPEDDGILATAVSGKAGYLVTGDAQLRKLGSFKDVTILSPAEFQKTLTATYEEAA